MLRRKKEQNTGAGPEILKSGGALCRPPCLADEKAKITLETISFWQNIYIGILSFSPFLYTMKASSPMKSYQFFKNVLVRKEIKHLCISQ